MTVYVTIPHERAITLVFWHWKWLVDDAPFRLKFALKVTQLLQKKNADSTDSAYNVSIVKDSEKKFIYDEKEVDHGQMKCIRYPESP